MSVQSNEPLFSGETGSHLSIEGGATDAGGGTGRTAEGDFSAKALETVGCLVMVLDVRGRIIQFNGACEQLMEIPAASATGRMLWELPSIPVEEAPLLAAIFARGEIRCAALPTIPEFDLLTSTGIRRHVAWNSTCVCNDSKLATHIILAGVDVTEARQAKAAAERARMAAEAANRAKTEFLANMSHEIRTPMTAILGHIDLLEDGRSSEGEEELTPHERRQSLRTIRRNTEHLLQLVNDVLDLSKIEAGKLTIERVACCPLQIISEVAAVMRVRALEKRIAFQVQYIGPVPQTITSDPTRLRQILINLLGNAFKFTHSGSVRLLVRLLNHNSLDKPQLQFQVVDTGIGMTQEQITALFRPFTQGDSTTSRRYGGTGLGLSITKKLTEAMGGSIAVDSISGAGTTFTASIDPGSLKGVELILDAGGGDAAFASRARLAGHAGSEQLLAGRRILLAEDGPDNQYLISLLLRRAGAKVTTADNGRYAMGLTLDATREGQPFDLILMDMQMPEMDGYAATRRLRERGYTGRIMALTAHTMPGDRERCLAEGCDEYLPKPFEPETLIDAVVATMGRGKGGEAESERQIEPAPTEPRAGMRELEYTGMEENAEASLQQLALMLEKALAAEDLAMIGRSASELKREATAMAHLVIAESAALVERGVRAGLGIPHMREAIKDLIRLCTLPTGQGENGFGSNKRHME
ncbi:MAG TPA: ATP-binding protein [Phycisphaerae bacterium]|nr:ATP-binding protein [Phycisphaerae bacterium]